jgi:hypothetical protein
VLTVDGYGSGAARLDVADSVRKRLDSVGPAAHMGELSEERMKGKPVHAREVFLVEQNIIVRRVACAVYPLMLHG